MKHKILTPVVLLAGTFVGLALLGGLINAVTPPPVTAPGAIAVTTTTTASSAATVSRTVTVETAQTYTDTDASFGLATWTVGPDIPAGTYRLAVGVPRGSTCYWERSKGTDENNIIKNDIISQGRPVVTLLRGETFKSQHCGTWVHQK